MKIDRSLFLILTATVAGVACAADPPPKSPSNPSPAPSISAGSSAAPTAAPASSTPTTASATPTASVTASASATTTAPPPTASTTPAPPRPPIDPSKQKPLGFDQGCAQSSVDYDDKKTACDDNTGPTAECNQLARGYPSHEGSVCPGASPVMRRCATYNTNFKPKVATDAFACFQGFKGRACNGCFLFACGHKALMNACPDPTADADCDKIEQSCSGMGRVQCRSYLSGMSARGRQAMVDCLTKSCNKGFGTCLVGLQ